MHEFNSNSKVKLTAGHFLACWLLLFTFLSSSAASAGFVVNSRAPQTGTVVGRALGSPDMVSASGTFAGTYNQNQANGGAIEFVTVNSNALISPPNPGGVANPRLQNNGNAYTNCFHGLVEINQGALTNYGGISATFSSLPASTGPLYGLDPYVSGFPPAADAATNNYFYGIGLLAWCGNVGYSTSSSINNTSGATIKSIVTGGGTSLAMGIYSLQYYGNSGIPNMVIHNSGTVDGEVTNVDGTAAGIYHYNLYGGVNLTNHAGGVCNGAASYYSSGITVSSYYGAVNLQNDGSARGLATGAKSGWVSGLAYSTGIDVFSYDNNSNAPVNIGNTGLATATTMGGNTNFCYGMFLWAEGGAMTLNNSGTISATSTPDSAGGCDAIYCGGNRGADLIINSGAITATAGAHGGWALGVENDTTIPNDPANSITIVNSGSIYHNNGLGVAVFAGTGPAIISNSVSGSISGGNEGIAAENYPGNVTIYNYGSIQAGSAGNNAIDLGPGNDTVYLYGLPNIFGVMNGGGGTNTLNFQLNGVLQKVNGWPATLGTNLAAYHLGTSGSIVVSGQTYSWANFNVAGTTTSALTNLYHWSAPVSFNGLTATQILASLPGVYYEAAAFGGQPTNQTVQVGNTAYNFKVDGSSASISGGYGSTYTWGGGGFSGNTGNISFNALLSDFYFDGGTHGITLHNLIPGQTYSAQLFALDDRTGATARQSSFQDPNNANDVSTTFAMGDNVYVVGTFTATSTDMTIQQNLPTSGNGNTEAVVVRALTAPSPVITPSGSTLQLNWPYGTLLQATNITGPWTTNPASSPASITPTLPTMFYKIQLP